MFNFFFNRISVFFNSFFETLIVKVISFYWSFFLAPRFRADKKKRSAEKPRLFFGPIPIINNKYWSEAMKELGYTSRTCMREYAYNINNNKDYDLYLIDMFPPKKSHLGELIRRFRVLKFIVANYDILHISCLGISFSRTEEKYKARTHLTETFLLKSSGCKTVILPFGGDMSQYSKITDNSFKHTMLICYPKMALIEDRIAENVKHWTKYADTFLTGFQIDGIGRWDMLCVNPLVIDTSVWVAKSDYSMADGKNGPVRITHSPNHRGIKGTEFLLCAIEELRQEGFLIELNLLEKKPNSEVKKVLYEETDILAEEFNLGYGLNGIEGMCTGLPVMSHMNNQNYTQVMYRYSFLKECPILSTSLEQIKDHLRILITNPQLRITLGKAGRSYVEKYHSYKRAQFMFEKIYDKIWYNKDVDLINLFHPLKPDSYNNQSPKIEHPLKENRLPENYRTENKITYQPTKNQ